jgi:hypothetical protein
MKIYTNSFDLKKSTETHEITIVADTNELRRLARFFNLTAELLEKHGKAFGHEHLQDFENKGFDRKPDIIVSRSSVDGVNEVISEVN